MDYDEAQRSTGEEGVMEETVDVTAVRVLAGTVVLLSFEEGVSRVLDLRPLMRGPVFDAIFEAEQFDQLRVDPELGTVVWPNGVDLSPDVLRQHESGLDLDLVETVPPASSWGSASGVIGALVRHMAGGRGTASASDTAAMDTFWSGDLGEAMHPEGTVIGVWHVQAPIVPVCHYQVRLVSNVCNEPLTDWDDARARELLGLK